MSKPDHENLQELVNGLLDLVFLLTLAGTIQTENVAKDGNRWSTSDYGSG
jgi:hypothetical protein